MKFIKRMMQSNLLVLSKFALFVGGTAVTMSCRTVFYEEEIPQKLKNHHPFFYGESD
ncbi:cyclic lactone autoinducer peptide [Metasolibacillus meyeri]|uniref:Cyclic lactone autoinducer peptide n=1 Tax=Metasolibacillus meyeri TaxID=1071052 RepID=A0AAW9NMF5_9BACL|nr:cyclic lactone autoinducer peptide [Metasolibacillus meyeri]MEC1178560.1 cyclic lactone autoinducer peptide [Metasolibacillus meyeri]